MHYLLILSFGSNIGDRCVNIANAFDILRSRLINNYAEISSLIVTEPLLTDHSPEEWKSMKYVNACAAINLTKYYHPTQILQIIKATETELGRVEHHQKWGPREIDIDIVHYGNIQYRSRFLTIPHSEYLKRDFVLTPMAELCTNRDHVPKLRTVLQ